MVQEAACGWMGWPWGSHLLKPSSRARGQEMTAMKALYPLLWDGWEAETYTPIIYFCLNNFKIS